MTTIPATDPSIRRAGGAWPERLVPWLLPVVAALVPLAFSTGLADSFELAKLVLLATGLAVAGLGLALGAPVDTGVARAPATLAAALFAAVAALATIGSVAPAVSLFGNYQHDQGLLTLGLGLGYFALAAAWVRTVAALARVVAGLAIAAAATSVYAIAQSLGVDPWGWSALTSDLRPTTGTLGHPNSLAEFLALTLPLSAWLAWSLRGWRRDLTLWSIALQLVALVLTQARTALLVTVGEVLLAALLLLCARWRAGRWPRWPLAFGAQAAALAAIVILAGSPALSGRLDRLVSRVANRGLPLQGRQLLWQSLGAMVRDRPLLGWGPDTLQLASTAYRSPALDALENAVLRTDAAHNVLLGAAVDAGLLGALAFLAVHVAVAATLVRALIAGAGPAAGRGVGPAALALLVAWVGYFLLFMLGESRATTTWLFWLLGGIAVGLSGAPRRVRRPAPLARAVAAALAAVLLAWAGTAAVADAAYFRSAAQPAGEAVATLRLAVALRPYEPTYRQELGIRLAEDGAARGDAARDREALDALAIASGLWGGREPYAYTYLARASLGLAALTGGSGEEALGDVRRAIALDPQNPLLRADLADAYVDLGRQGEARDAWEAGRVLARTPDALERLGDVALRLGDPDAARQLYRTAAGRQWRPAYQAPLYRAWGEAAYAVGRWDEAAQAFGEALAREPGDAPTHLRRAEALDAGGHRADALAEARRALALDPGSAAAMALVARLAAP